MGRVGIRGLPSAWEIDDDVRASDDPLTLRAGTVIPWTLYREKDAAGIHKRNWHVREARAEPEIYSNYCFRVTLPIKSLADPDLSGYREKGFSWEKGFSYYESYYDQPAIDVLYKTAPVTTLGRVWGLIADVPVHIAGDDPTFAFASEPEAPPFLPIGRGPERAPQQVSPSLEEQFEDLAAQWDDETWAYSFVERKVLNRAYQRIMAMGPPVLPFIFRRLAERGPDHWFWALEMITGANPADGAETMDESTEAWLQWARENGYLQSPSKG